MSNSLDVDLEETQKPRSKTDNVIKEIVETEKEFGNDILNVLSGYEDFFKNYSEKHIFTLIENGLKDLLEFSSSFYEDLFKNMTSIANLGNIFINYSESMIKYFGNYCEVFPIACKIIENLDRNSEIALLIEHCKKKANQMLPLSSYLLKPIQRVLKYHLLIRSIESDKSLDDETKKIIDVASEKMKHVADTINEQKRIQEGFAQLPILRKKIVNLDSPLNFDLVGPIILEDDLKANNRKKHILLFEKVLMLANTSENGDYSVKKAYRTDNLVLIEFPKDGQCIEIYEEGEYKKRYSIKFKKTEIKELWVLHIKRLILKNMGLKLDNKQLEALFGTTSANKIATIENANNLQYIDDLLFQNEQLSNIKNNQGSQKNNKKQSLHNEKISDEEKVKAKRSSFNLSAMLESNLSRSSSLKMKNKRFSEKPRTMTTTESNIDRTMNIIKAVVINRQAVDEDARFPISEKIISHLSNEINTVLEGESTSGSCNEVRSNSVTTLAEPRSPLNKDKQVNNKQDHNPLLSQKRYSQTSSYKSEPSITVKQFPSTHQEITLNNNLPLLNNEIPIISVASRINQYKKFEEKLESKPLQKLKDPAIIKISVEKKQAESIINQKNQSEGRRSDVINSIAKEISKNTDSSTRFAAKPELVRKASKIADILFRLQESCKESDEKFKRKEPIILDISKPT